MSSIELKDLVWVGFVAVAHGIQQGSCIYLFDFMLTSRARSNQRCLGVAMT